MTLHLGKRPATPDPNRWKIGSLLDIERVSAAPPPPVPRDHGFKLLMYGNGPDDSVRPGFGGCGCCVWAAFANAIQLSRHALGLAPAPITGKEVVATYSKATGYVIGEDSTDQGTDMGRAMSFMRKTGMVDAAGHAHKLLAYAAVDPANKTEWTASLRAFATVDIGILFPDYFMTDFDDHKPWNYKPGPLPQDGHSILVVRETTTGWDVDSWARELGFNDPARAHLCDEAFALIFADWINQATGKDVDGLDYAQLDKALAALA